MWRGVPGVGVTQKRVHNLFRNRKKAFNLLEDTSGNVQVATIEEFMFPNKTFEIIFSRNEFHTIEDIRSVFEKVFKALHPGGQFVFSVQHPIVTASIKPLHKERDNSKWSVEGYFYIGPRTQGSNTIVYHRTIDDYFRVLKQVGFKVENIREPRPKKSDFRDVKAYINLMRVPRYLIFSCYK